MSTTFATDPEVKVRRKSAGLWVLFAALAVSAADLALHYPELPDSVATHFDLAGRPNGWMSKKAFAVFSAVTLGGLVVVFLGVPALLRRLPVSLVNIPHREYWLAPERRLETIASISRALHWLGAGTMVFVLITLHSVMEVHLARRPDLGPAFLWGLAAYLIYVAWWVVRLLRRFRLPSGSA